jgi:hypothetical protein
VDENNLFKLLSKHYKICDMVLLANRHLKFYIISFYVIFLPNVCFLGHHLLFYENDWRVKGGFALFTCCSILEVLLVSLSTAKICSEAHRPSHIVHGIGLRRFPDETRFQVFIIKIKIWSLASIEKYINIWV